MLALTVLANFSSTRPLRLLAPVYIADCSGVSAKDLPTSLTEDGRIEKHARIASWRQYCPMTLTFYELFY